MRIVADANLASDRSIAQLVSGLFAFLNRPRWGFVSSIPTLANDGGPVVVGVFRDVTEACSCRGALKQFLFQVVRARP